MDHATGDDAQPRLLAELLTSAMAQMTDDYMDRLPVVLGTSVEEVKEQLQPFVEAGVTRLIIPYVPTGDAVVEDGWRFLRAWEAHR